MALNNVSWSYDYDPPPDISTNYSGWLQWLNKRVAQYDLHCPLARSKTYYFAQSGDDTTGDGSEALPYKTFSKAVALVAASSGDIRCRFKRGDVWEEAGLTLDINKNNITIDDYGIGNKPFLNLFTVKYTSGWTLASGNRYTRTETNDIAWVREQNDRFGEIRGTHLIRMADAAGVGSTSNSFWWDSGSNTLHINLNGDNPNSIALEAVISNAINGIAFQGDGCRAENIRADGYGCHRTSTATQCEGIKSRGSGTNANYFVGCESYFNSSHCMAHYAATNAGGKGMFYRCIAGFAKYNSGGETIFNTYAGTGGQETWFIDCTVAYGTLKSSDWTYSTTPKRGIGFYGHTSGSVGQYSDLIVKYRCSVPSSSYSQPLQLSAMANTAPGTGSIADARYYLVNSLFKANTQKAAEASDFTSNGVIYGNKFYFYRLNTLNANTWALESPANCWVINNYWDMDCTDITTNGFYLLNAPGVAKTNNNRLFFWHNLILFRNTANVASGAVGIGIDNDSANDTDAAPSATADNRNGEFKNNIIAYQTANGGLMCAFSNYATRQKNNAYYQVAQFNNQTRGYNLDPVKVTPGSFPSLSVSQSQYLLAGTADVMLSHDINGKARTVSPPDLGPVDFSS